MVVSFDGAGWHEKWQYWQGIAGQVPFHFTGFLTGLYLLTDATKDNYQGPGHGAGKTSLGSWNSAADTRQEILDLNDAYQRGDEIGTHFNGHFCDDNPPGAFEWNHADWNNELDQFFHFLTDYQTINAGDNLAKLDFGPSEIRGERTPCLEGNAEDLFPALIDHHMVYDSSFTRRGISWPKKSPQYKIWQMGMAEFPIHGTTPPHFQITMDYNFWFTQENASSTVDPAKSAQDAAQVQATYQDMYDGGVHRQPCAVDPRQPFRGMEQQRLHHRTGKFRPGQLRQAEHLLRAVPGCRRLDERPGSQGAGRSAEPRAGAGWR